MKTIFTYKSEIINSYLIISVGKSYKEILKHAEKNYTKNAIGMIKAFEENFIMENHLGKFIEFYSDNGERLQIILMKDWKNEDNFKDTLLHEIIHFKQATVDSSTKYANESEFEAYFIESTFRQIREKLNSKLK